VHDLLQDLRFGVRMLLRTPAFTIITLLTLALGIGANTAIFSIVKGVVLLPLPYDHPEELGLLRLTSPTGAPMSASIPNFLDVQRRNESLASVGAFRGVSLTVTGTDRPERVLAYQVSAGFFPTLRTPAVVGLAAFPDADQRGAEPRAVISHGLWQRRFGGDEAVLGTTVNLEGQPFTIVGVMPPSFAFPTGLAEMWVPLGAFASQLPWDVRSNAPGLGVLARAKPKLTMAAVERDLTAVIDRMAEEYGNIKLPSIQMRSLRDVMVGGIESTLWILMAVVGAVLLIACANVAGLLLARGEARQPELAVRTAVGAGRRRLVHQMLTESALLAVVGAGLGLLLSFVGLRLIVQDLSRTVFFTERIGIDGWTLVFTVGITAVTAVLFGLLPALRATRGDLHLVLKEGGRSGSGGSRPWLRGALVVGEVALAVVLLVSAALMVQSVLRLWRVDPGFRAEGVLTMRLSLPAAKYQDVDSTRAFFDRLLPRLEALPGVRSASFSNSIPLAGPNSEGSALPEGRIVERESMEPALYQMISPKHFQTLGISRRGGEDFPDNLTAGAPPIAIVDAALAEAFWPGEDPIGKRVAFEYRGKLPTLFPNWRTVVGVVDSVHHYELATTGKIQIYVPAQQPPFAFQQRWPDMALLLKTEGDPAALIAGVRQTLAALDPDVPIYQVQTLEELVDLEVAQDRFRMQLLTVFSIIALLLAAVGLYGVISYSVSQRLHEMGIRIALGATAGDIKKLVVGQGLVLTGIGLGLGLVAAFLFTRVLRRVLFGIDAADPLTFAAVALFLGLVGLIATYLPARRATRVNPIQALRAE
jgi:predicted permease